MRSSRWNLPDPLDGALEIVIRFFGSHLRRKARDLLLGLLGESRDQVTGLAQNAFQFEREAA